MPVQDITRTGALNYRALQQKNSEAFDSSQLSDDDLMRMAVGIGKNLGSFTPEATTPTGIQAAQAGYGNSQYDDAVRTQSQLENIGEVRYNEQAWYDTLANGVGKMLGTAGTTFVSSLIGLPYGLFEAASQGRWSALWDNDVTQGLAQVDKWLEENMQNYRSQEQQENPWYDPSNLISMNFIADDVIKNMGFTLGAAASMAVGSGSLGLLSRSLGFVNRVGGTTKMAGNVLSALFSATGEGMIEARQGVEERNRLEMQKLDDSLLPEEEALRQEFEAINREYAANRNKAFVRGADGNVYDPAYEDYKAKMEDLNVRRDALQQRREAGRQQIEESGRLMGNRILLANQGLLTAGNLIQFSKTMTKSFDRARHAAETSSKAARPSGVGASRVSSNIRDGYKVDSPTFGRLKAATKGIFTEGSEEMNQQWIQSSSGAAYNEVDVNDYWKAKTDPDSYRETTKGLYTLGQILDRGFQESWGDADQWEQFVIGGLTGMTGSYSPTKLFNQDKKYGAFDPRRYGSWEGGAYNEIRDFNKEYQQYQENIDEVNRILASEDFPARVRSMVGHTYTEQEKEAALEGDDKKAWKDADDKQNIHDIQAFLRAGKLDDLRAIYEEMGSQLSDDDIENIVKSTTREVSAEEDKQQFDNQIDEQIASHQRKIVELNQQAQDIADTQQVLEVGERGEYPVAVTPALEGIFAKIDRENDAINRLQQQKQAYTGQKRYEGAYVDSKGNRTATNDEIRAEHQHNSEELNRKLDSYLESIDYVNRRTNGRLTKDQEDNLAYLHNMGKESNRRMQKIMANVRKQLPSKFLLKTTKTPEQLAQEYASSDLSFSKDEDTKEGYVEVDTSAMNDAAFADFFQREIMRGGNIMPEFAETADEKAAREEEERNLPEAERKKRARERATKKWQSAVQQMQDDAGEQWDTNWQLLVDNFMDNYRKRSDSTLDETIEAFSQVRQDLQDASDLYDQAGEFQRTLMEYMQNPSLVDKAREKEENKADKANQEQQQKNKFAGKDAKQMNQELADGTLDIDDLDDFAGADLSDVTDDDVKAAQQEARKSQEIRQRQAAMKNLIQENLGDNPTQDELNAAELAMQMVDNAALNAENPDDLNIDMPELNQIPIDAVDPNASIDTIDSLNQNVQQMLADAFNAMEEDRNARADIPDAAPAENEGEDAETGHDPVPKTVAETAVPLDGTGPQNQSGPIIPSSSGSSAAAPTIVPKSPLTEGAINNIIDAVRKMYDSPVTAGTWRSTTTRHPYGRSTGTYHEDVAKQQFGENSVEYKRSKAIWEYLNSVGTFDRMENPSTDRIKAGDAIHFMVAYLPEIFGSRIEEVSDENKPKAMVIFMVNDNGEVLGDLPLAEFEPSYKAGNPTQQVKDLKNLQDKIFNAFLSHYGQYGGYKAIVDGTLKVDGLENLNLTFDNAKKTPLVSKVKQVMRGVVPFSKTERHTLNEVANGEPLELGVRVTGTTVAKKKGDKAQHKDIVVPGVGSMGQPYLLMKTASGEQMAIPFYMPAFNHEQHKNTELYKLLANTIYHILANNNQSARGKEAYRKHMDVIEGLLQVRTGENKRVVEVTPDHIALYFVSLTDPNQEINIQIPKTASLAADAQSLVDQLGGIPINVSLQFLNDKIETGLDAGNKYTRTYNQVIGEIADINLPQNTQHTVNSWFTVELAPTTGVKPSRKVQPRITGKYNETINGRNIEFDTDNLVAVDTTTGEVIEDDTQIDLMLAEIQANKPINKDKDRIQISINGRLYTYDAKDKKFVKTPAAKPETPAVPVQKVPKSGKPAYFSSMQKQLEDKKSSYATYLEDSKKVKNGEVIVSGPRWQSTIEPTLRLAVDAGILPEQYRDLVGKDTAPYDRVQVALNSLMMEGITKPQNLLNAVEKKFPISSVASEAVSFTAPQSSGISNIAKQYLEFGDYGIYPQAKAWLDANADINYPISSLQKKFIIGYNRSTRIVNAWKAERVATQQPSAPVSNPLAESLEQIEKRMKDNKVVGRQTKDAWAAVPDDLKMKLVNEDALLQLSYGDKKATISMRNLPAMKEALKEANMAAKGGSLTVNEVLKPMEKDGITLSREKEQAARRWLAKNLPMLSSEERTQFVEKLARGGKDAGKIWGSYRAGVIEIARNAPMGTVYHEAFHYVLDIVLSPEERREILNIAKEEYGLDDTYQVEERLANDFRRYAMDENATGIMGRIKRWLRKISDRINRYNRISDVTINQLFWKINNGELAQRSTEAENFEEAQQRVLMEIRNVQREKMAWRNLSPETKTSLKDSGLSETAYTDMSLEEKQQYVRCRG